MMSYEMSKISWEVRLLFWNHEPCLMDLDSEHVAPATFLRHRHLNPSGILGCADQVTSRPQVLHCILLQSSPSSFKNCIPIAWSEKRYVRNVLFGPPSSRSIRCLYDDFVMNAISRCRLYSAKIWSKHWTQWRRNYVSNKQWLWGRQRKCVALWALTKNTEKKVNGIHVSCCWKTWRKWLQRHTWRSTAYRGHDCALYPF